MLAHDEDTDQLDDVPLAPQSGQEGVPSPVNLISGGPEAVPIEGLPAAVIQAAVSHHKQTICKYLSDTIWKMGGNALDMSNHMLHHKAFAAVAGASLVALTATLGHDQLVQLSDQIKGLFASKPDSVTIGNENIVYVDRIVEVEKVVEVEKPITVEKVVYLDKLVTVEKPVYVDKFVPVDKIVPVEKVVYVDRVKEVEKPYYVEKLVEVEKPYYVEKLVEVRQPCLSASSELPSIADEF